MSCSLMMEMMQAWNVLIDLLDEEPLWCRLQSGVEGTIDNGAFLAVMHYLLSDSSTFHWVMQSSHHMQPMLTNQGIVLNTIDQWEGRNLTICILLLFVSSTAQMMLLHIMWVKWFCFRTRLSSSLSTPAHGRSATWFVMSSYFSGQGY